MLDIKVIRENPEKIKKAAADKGVEVDIPHVVEIDTKYRELLMEVEKLREQRNRLAKERNIEGGKQLKDTLEKQEHALDAVKTELDLWLAKIPNPAKEDVKVGKDESENEIVRKYKEPTQFPFTPKDHMALGALLDIFDTTRAAKVSGARFNYMKNAGVLLEFALVQYAFDFLIGKGFIPIIPPVLVRTEVMKGLGYMENGGDEDMFMLPKDELVLVATAEHSIVPMYMNEVLDAKNLPQRFVGFSSAFRREAGSYGKDTKGIIRVHQFDKVEMVSFVKEGEDDHEHEYLLGLEEELFQSLEIPYQVVKMCTGDLGFPAARKYDIEAWIPTQNKYREVTSVSTVTDFQSRRLNIRYQDGNEKKYVHVLNGTAFSTNRPIIAILENYQQEDGNVVIPQVLRKYLNGLEKISPKK